MGRRGNRPQGRRRRWRREGRPRDGGRRRYGADGRGGGGGILLTIILLAAIAFAVWYFVIRDDGTSDVTPTTTPSPTVSITSTPEGET